MKKEMNKNTSQTRKQMQSQWHTDKSNCGLLSGYLQFSRQVINTILNTKDSRTKFETAAQLLEQKIHLAQLYQKKKKSKQHRHKTHKQPAKKPQHPTTTEQ